LNGTVISAVLVGGDGLLREGLKRLLTGGPIDVAGAATDLDAVFDSDVPLPVDCYILLGRPAVGDDLVTALERLRARSPGAKIVLLDENKDPHQAIGGLRAGVDGYFHLGISADALVYAVATTVMGEPIVATRMIGPLISVAERFAPPRIDGSVRDAGQKRGLSDREMAILDCLVRGDANKTIADRFGVSEASVKRQVRALLQKLGVTNRTQAAVWALENGFGR